MPRLLDLFCCAGEAALGYAEAGFEVVGVDIQPQPYYPFEFIQANALSFPLAGFDAIHASPPCQAFAARGRARDSHQDLIALMRFRLSCQNVPWVIENIPAAPLQGPITLCGQMFGLGVFRHRNFEANFHLLAPPHEEHNGKVGDGEYFTVTGHPGGIASKKSGNRFVDGGSITQWRQAMGCTRALPANRLVEAIPRAYTAYIGRQLLSQVQSAHG